MPDPMPTQSKEPSVWAYIDNSGTREARVLDVTKSTIFIEHRRIGAVGSGQHTRIPTRLASRNMDTIMGWTRREMEGGAK